MSSYTEISSVLSRLLDSLGFSEENRQRRMACQRVLQLIFDARDYGKDHHVLIGGSQFETTTLDDMNSDTDAMIEIRNQLRVINNLNEWRPNIRTNITTSPDSDHLAIHCMIYRLYSHAPRPLLGLPIWSNAFSKFGYFIDSDQKVYLGHEELKKCFFPSEILMESHFHGPSVSVQENLLNPESDLALALRLTSWPAIANGWLERNRNSLNSDVLKLANYCYIVPKGRKGAEMEQFHWTYSFAHIEKALVHNWSNFQYKCYVMLKIILKQIIKTRAPETLTSYHFKTLLFWMNEDYIFKGRNLVGTLRHCLQRMLSAVRSGVLKHYFVPRYNLFIDAWDETMDTDIETTLDEMISTWPETLYSLQLKDIGHNLRLGLVDPMTLADVTRSYERDCNKMMVHRLTEIYKRFDELKKSFKHETKEIQECNDIFIGFTAVTEEEKQLVLFLVEDLECLLCTRKLSATVTQDTQLSLQKQCCIDTSLKIATVFLKSKNYEQMIVLLNEIESKFQPHVNVVCGHFDCPIIGFVPLDNYFNEQKPTMRTFFQDYVAFTVEFTDNEMDIVPQGLDGEMNRTASCSQSGQTKTSYWMKNAVVHPYVYLLYLRFLHAVETNREKSEVQSIIDKMESVVQFPSPLHVITHRETSRNILGHCYILMGNKTKASEQFRMSLALRPVHNAVNQHKKAQPWSIFCSYFPNANDEDLKYLLAAFLVLIPSFIICLYLAYIWF